MDITFNTDGPVTIISLTGKLDSGSASEVQDSILDKIVSDIKFVLDMESCTFVSSAGLRTLLIIAKRVKSENAVAAMATVADEILDVMEMTGFDDMFATYDSVNQAVDALTV